MLENSSLRRLTNTDEIEAHIHELIASAPSLTEATKERLRVLLAH